MAFSPDGKTLASGSWFGSIILWDITRENLLGEPIAANANNLAFSPDGKIIAFSNRNGGVISLWNTTIQQSVNQLILDNTIWTAMVISPDGKIFASGSDDKTIILWHCLQLKPF